jgi:hypothetical protein
MQEIHNNGGIIFETFKNFSRIDSREGNDLGWASDRREGNWRKDLGRSGKEGIEEQKEKLREGRRGKHKPPLLKAWICH